MRTRLFKTPRFPRPPQTPSAPPVERGERDLQRGGRAARLLRRAGAELQGRELRSVGAEGREVVEERARREACRPRPRVGAPGGRRRVGDAGVARPRLDLLFAYGDGR